MDPPPGCGMLQSFPGPGFILKARGASAFRLPEVSSPKATRRRPKWGCRPSKGPRVAGWRAPLPCPSVEVKREEAPPRATVLGRKIQAPPMGGVRSSDLSSDPALKTQRSVRTAEAGPERGRSASEWGEGGVSPRLERATLPRHDSSPRSRVSVWVVSRSDPPGTPRIRAAWPGEEVPGGRPAPSPRGGPPGPQFPRLGARAGAWRGPQGAGPKLWRGARGRGAWPRGGGARDVL